MGLPNHDGGPSHGERRSVRAFPWQSLDSMTRSEAVAMHRLRRWAAQHVRLDLVEKAMTDLVGAEVTIRTRRAQRLASAPAEEGSIAVRLSPSDSSEERARGVLLETEGALAATIAARVIKRASPAAVRAEGARSSGVAGALAAVVAAIARRAHAEAPLRIDAAGAATALETELLQADPNLVAVALTVLVADEAFVARVIMSPERLAGAPDPLWDMGTLARLGSTPLSVPVVACATTATVAEVGALRHGDVFLPGSWSLSRSTGGFEGAVFLSPPPYEVGIRARLGDGGRVVLGGELEPLLAAEADMAETDEKGALLTAMGDVPVVVRVEIGEACMPAREWASLGRGDVVALGCRVGEHVLLRVGGMAVARGELVEIDGEVGVRIVERLNGGLTAS
jgi:type III secretion system YscQ/HrcQ family protein